MAVAGLMTRRRRATARSQDKDAEDRCLYVYTRVRGCGLLHANAGPPRADAAVRRGYFFAVKAFMVGVIVILATGFIPILPDAFDNLSSDCLPAGGPWKDFPFAGFEAMLGAIGTLVVDKIATGYFRRVTGAKHYYSQPQ